MTNQKIFSSTWFSSTILQTCLYKFKAIYRDTKFLQKNMHNIFIYSLQTNTFTDVEKRRLRREITSLKIKKSCVELPPEPVTSCSVSTGSKVVLPPIHEETTEDLDQTLVEIPPQPSSSTIFPPTPPPTPHTSYNPT